MEQSYNSTPRQLSNDLCYDDVSLLPDNEKSLWQSAIESEISSLTTKKTFTIIDQPPQNSNIVDSKWVFKVKYNTDGSVNKYKARLCARGFTQLKGTDYNDTWAPTGRYNSLRLFLTLAAYNNFDIHVIDAISAFLNSKLDTPIFMKIPKGFPHFSEKFWRLNNTLYGLKQSPHLWNVDLDNYLHACGFSPSSYDPCLYSKLESDSTVSLIFVWVDDLFIASLPDKIASLIQQLSTLFDLTDNGPLQDYLNLLFAMTKVHDLLLFPPLTIFHIC